MTTLFADSFYYLAALNPLDLAHRDVLQIAEQRKSRIITSAWVLADVADGMATGRLRTLATQLIHRVLSDQFTTVVPPTDEWFQRGLALYAGRADKGWSLTDCISFEIMWKHGLDTALTGDRHFVQAGFTILP